MYKRYLLLIASVISMALPAAGYAEEDRWIVAAIDGGAWKSTDRDPSVRTALQPGDVIRSTDRLETFQNNQVTLAGDPAGQNLVAVRGEFRVRQGLAKTQVELNRGKALAVLDGLKGKGDFSVATPTGVASVRGTRFSVDAPLSRMDVKTFEGEVAVRSGGKAVRVAKPVYVAKGDRTVLEAGSKEPPALQKLSGKDWDEYKKDRKAVRAVRQSLKKSGAHWFEESAKPSRTRWVPAIEEDAANVKKDGPTILF